MLRQDPNPLRISLGTTRFWHDTPYISILPLVWHVLLCCVDSRSAFHLTLIGSDSDCSTSETHVQVGARAESLGSDMSTSTE